MVLAAIVAVVVSPGAPDAQANSRCDTATAQTADAQTAYDNALSDGVARAKALGFTDAEIADAKAALADGKVDAAEQKRLMDDYNSRDASAKVNVVTDLPLVKSILDTRLALNAAVAAQNVECNLPADAVPSTTAVVVPSSAPAAGDGSLAGR